MPGEARLPVDPLEQLFLANLPFIDRAAAKGCRRYGLNLAESEDFAQEVKLKLVDDGYGVLRKFKRVSSIEGYLAMVVANALRDYANKLWGKWRPSQEAQKLGPLAVCLERLLVRDQRTLSEACQTLWTDFHLTASESELHDLALRLPPRLSRRADVSLDSLAGPSGAGGADAAPSQIDQAALPHWTSNEPADARVRYGEAARLRLRLRQALAAAMLTLDDEDRVIVLRRTERSVAEIARELHLEQKPLYRRLDKILARLRAAMESAGVRSSEVADMLDSLGESDPADHDDNHRDD
jgi:RNA polymerase sigma factor (sigma-70 family)